MKKIIKRWKNWKLLNQLLKRIVKLVKKYFDYDNSSHNSRFNQISVDVIKKLSLDEDM